MSTTTTERRARKAKVCAGCGETIKAGAVYLEHRAAPFTRGLDNPTWQTKVECLACAGRLGRRSDQAPEDFMVPLIDLEHIA